MRAVRVKRRGIAVPGVARPGLKAGHRDTAPREDRGLVWPLLLLGTAGFSMAFEVKVTG